MSFHWIPILKSNRKLINIVVGQMYLNVITSSLNIFKLNFQKVIKLELLSKRLGDAITKNEQTCIKGSFVIQLQSHQACGKLASVKFGYYLCLNKGTKSEAFKVENVKWRDPRS